MSHQDMPPPGGFGSISIERTFAKPLIRQSIYSAILFFMSVKGYMYIKEWKKRYRIFKAEQTEHYIAAAPFLFAEQERKYLSYLRAIREEERELMKNVPGWKLGTLYGEPVFKTLPKDMIPPISMVDFAVHRPSNEFIDRVVVLDFHA